MPILELIYRNNFIVNILLSIALFLLSIFIPLFYKKKQRPKYISKSRTTITSLDSEFSDLETYYKKNKIEKLTETRLYFWNAGDTSIRKWHLLKATPVTIHIPDDIEICQIDHVSTQDLKTTLEIHKNECGNYELSFEAMQKNDGVCFRFLHSGNENCSMSVLGKLDGLLQIKKAKISSDPYQKITWLDKLFCNTTFRALVPSILFFISAIYAVNALVNELSFRALPEYRSFSTWFSPLTLESNTFSRYIRISITLFLLALSTFFSFRTHTPIPVTLMLLSKERAGYTFLYTLKAPNHTKKGTEPPNHSSTKKPLLN